MDEKDRIIFLDIDGVLNGESKLSLFLYKIFYFFHKELWLKEKLNIFSVQEKKMKILSEIVKRTDAKIVLCAAMRFTWFNVPYEMQRKKCKRLSLFLYKYNLDIIDVTHNMHDGYTREDEINSWLLTHKDMVSSYIIIDDENELYPHLGEKHLVRTSSDNSKISGLSKKHINEALNLFNKQESLLDD